MTEPRDPIRWREKFLAFAVHFVATALLGAVAAALIFLVWFPAPFASMVGGTELFMLVVGCDLALGPLMSLVIYNSRKPRRKLIIDYVIVGIVQLAAMIYGVDVVAESRPVYVAFSGDRLEIVAAGDIRPDELAKASAPRYASIPWTGPRLISIVVPDADHNDALFESLSGNEEHQRPKFYAPYEAELARLRSRAGTVAALEKKFPRRRTEIEAAVRQTGLPPERVRWLPVRHIQGFWTAFVDVDSGLPQVYLDLDPY